MRNTLTMALLGTAVLMGSGVGPVWAACDESTAAKKTLFYQFGIEDGERGRAARVTACPSYTEGYKTGTDLRAATRAMGNVALTDENFQKLLNGTLLSSETATLQAAMGGNGQGERVMGSSRARVKTYACNEKKVAWQEDLMEKGRRDGLARVPKLLPNCRSYEQGYAMGLRGMAAGTDTSRAVVYGDDTPRMAKEMGGNRDRGNGMSIGGASEGSSAGSIGGGSRVGRSSSGSGGGSGDTHATRSEVNSSLARERNENYGFNFGNDRPSYKDYSGNGASRKVGHQGYSTKIDEK